MTSNETELLADNADYRVPTLYPWHKIVWDRVTQQVAQQHLPHATLFKGIEASGLEEFSRLFAYFLLCASPNNNLPCGQCRDCYFLSVGSHPGLSIIKPEPTKKDPTKISKVITVDQIRDVIDTVNQTSFNNGRKVLVISPSDVMHPSAANALLKSLEEPSSNTFFLLVSQKSSKLLATIRSRCQIIELPLPQSDAADKWLASKITDLAQRKQLLAMSGDNPLLAARWFTDKDSDSVLKLGDELRRVIQGEMSPITLATAWHKNNLLNRITWWWRWLALELKLATEQNTLLALPVSSRQLLLFMQKLLAAKRQLESSANPNEQLLLESLLIDWQKLKNT